MHTNPESLIFKPYLDGTGGYTGGPGLEEVNASVPKVYKLSSNENPLGPSPKALKALQAASRNLHIYPDRTPIRLQQALQSYYQDQLTAEQFLVANSGSEVLELIMRGFLREGDEYIYSNPCFSPYKMFAKWQGAVGVHAPLTQPDYQWDVSAILSLISERTRLIFLTSPNNPTGTFIPQGTLEFLLDNMPPHVVLVYDEVYFHFANDPRYTTALPYVQEGYPMIAINSFSKTYGLAALRLGYGYTTSKIAAYLRQLVRPFLVNTLNIEAGIAALEDQDFVAETVALVQQERNVLYKVFDTLPLTYWESQGNFVLIKPQEAAHLVEKKLMRRGIMVREMESFGAPGCLRITVGNKEANSALCVALKEIL